MADLVNVPFDEIEVGMTAEYEKHITERDITLFAILSGDTNPLHLDAEYAKTTQFGGCIAHGAICAVIVSAAVATTIPAAVAIVLGESRFGAELTHRGGERAEDQRRERERSKKSSGFDFHGLIPLVAPSL